MENQLSSGTSWVSRSGQVIMETESQRRLFNTPSFQLGLALYNDAYRRYLFTAESQRQALNQRMQQAYEQDTTYRPDSPSPSE